MPQLFLKCTSAHVSYLVFQTKLAHHLPRVPTNLRVKSKHFARNLQQIAIIWVSDKHIISSRPGVGLRII